MFIKALKSVTNVVIGGNTATLQKMIQRACSAAPDNVLLTREEESRNIVIPGISSLCYAVIYIYLWGGK